jgi:hypothetical protein
LNNEGQGKIYNGTVKNLARKITDSLKQIPIQSKENSPKKIYIPTLRGLRHWTRNTLIYIQSVLNKIILKKQTLHPKYLAV